MWMQAMRDLNAGKLPQSFQISKDLSVAVNTEDIAGALGILKGVELSDLAGSSPELLKKTHELQWLVWLLAVLQK